MVDINNKSWFMLHFVRNANANTCTRYNYVFLTNMSSYKYMQT